MTGLMQMVPMIYTKSKTLMKKRMRTLTLDKFDFDHLLNSHYKVSTQKLCSSYISVDFKIFPPALAKKNW